MDDGRFCNVVTGAAAQAIDPITPMGIYANGSAAVVPSANTSSCDLCFIKLLQFQAQSPYYGGPDLISDYASLTSSCSITAYPLTTSTLPFSTTAASAPTAAPCSGKTYTVQPTDTCRSVSLSQEIGTDWLLGDNSLPAFCANFPANGTLCLVNTCSVYTVKANDTCSSVASANNITTAQLMAWNPIIDIGCYNLNASIGYQICIDSPGTPYAPPTTTFIQVTSATTAAAIPTNVANGTNTYCGLYYTPIPGDYCNLIVLRFGISLSDFVFLNPEINVNCTNLYAEESYCVEPVGNIDNYPGHSGYISSTPTIMGTVSDWGAYPTATSIATYNATTTSLPYANGTRSDCATYVDGSEQQVNITGSLFTSQCDAVTTALGVSLLDFEFWNPSLNTSDPNCALSPDYEYCGSWSGIEPSPSAAASVAPLPIRNGTISNCSQYADVTTGMTCALILDWYGITVAEFYEWNPEVNDDCSGLWLDYQYCVIGPGYVAAASSSAAASSTIFSSTATSTSTITPPTNTQAGQPANCDLWYTTKSGDDCQTVEEAYGITFAEFLAWNPAVSSDCESGFWLDEAYCVGVSASPTTTSSSTPTTTSTGIATPTPIQPSSIPNNCNEFELAGSGAGCYSLYTAAGISASDFYAWNLVVGADGADCGTEIWEGYYYCVGVS